jgi:hypothetical protein
MKAAAAGVYVSDINVRPIVKAAARIGSGIGVPDCACASGEQDRETNDSESAFEVIHLSLSVTLMVSIEAEASRHPNRVGGSTPSGLSL